MTGWTLFFIILGVAFLTAQLFRLIDFIERPTRHARRTAVYQKILPGVWNIPLLTALNEKRWMSWKS